MQDPIDRLERVVESLANSHQDLAIKMSQFTGSVQAALENNRDYISAVDRKLDSHMKEGKNDRWNAVMAAIAMATGVGSCAVEVMRHLHP
ncbi:MAG: hypothetical protein KGL39_14420 [Patescibacteria group bacterium]|nr:hypothetical protein [Patescibacteria group bacterium]